MAMTDLHNVWTSSLFEVRVIMLFITKQCSSSSLVSTVGKYDWVATNDLKVTE